MDIEESDHESFANCLSVEKETEDACNGSQIYASFLEYSPLKLISNVARKRRTAPRSTRLVVSRLVLEELLFWFLPSDLRQLSEHLSVMSGKTTSALVGNPPNNQRDYYIVRGLNRSYGLDNADPNDGFTYFAAKPVGYVHETKTVQALVGVVIMMLTILIPTIARVMLRVFNPGMEFGSDDWAIIVAAVSVQNLTLFLAHVRDTALSLLLSVCRHPFLDRPHARHLARRRRPSCMGSHLRGV